LPPTKNKHAKNKALNSTKNGRSACTPTTIFSEDSKVFLRMFFLQKSLDFNKKGDVDEFKHEWEALVRHLLRLLTKQLIHSYLSRLKPHI
jgi:hypothetical protein